MAFGLSQGLCVGRGAFCTAASLWQMALGTYQAGGDGELEAGAGGGGWWGCEVVEGPRG